MDRQTIVNVFGSCNVPFNNQTEAFAIEALQDIKETGYKSWRSSASDDSYLSFELINAINQLYLHSLEENPALEQIKKEYAVTVFEKKKLPSQTFSDTDEQIIQVEKIVSEMIPSHPLVKRESISKPLVEKLKKMLFGKTTPTLPIIQVHAMANLAYADYNLSTYKLIEKAFKDEDKSTIEHIEEMFVTDAKKSITKLIPLLSEGLQGTLILYIIKNYKGVKPENIERYYMPKS